MNTEWLGQLGFDPDDDPVIPQHDIEVCGPSAVVDLLATLDRELCIETAEPGHSEFLLSPAPAAKSVDRERSRGVRRMGWPLAALAFA